MSASINMNQFYTMGIICFFVIAVTSIYTGIVTWTYMDWGSKISTVTRIVFNFCLALFFNHLKKTSAPSKKEDLDIDSIISESGL